MLIAFSRAFEQWNREYLEDPKRFQDRAEFEALPTDTMGDRQARAFISYLNELAEGKPWDQIPPKDAA